MLSRKSPFPSKLFDGFSKRELQAFLEVLHYALEAENEADVLDVLNHVQKLVPFEYLIAGLVRLGATSGAQEFSKVYNVSYPEAWLSEYVRNQYASVDPVLLAHLRNFSTQIWAETYGQASTTKEKEFIDHARSFGLEDGVTTGAFEPRRGYGSFFSFAGGSTPDSARYLGLLEYLGRHLHHALVKSATSAAMNRVNGLSPRELSVLNWMKMGKTNWEISRILGVSERTVRFHVESIFNKLDVTSRTQAVALAVEQGLLSLT